MASLHRCIELRHLRYFLAAAEYGSFRKASVHIGVKESGVSRHIRCLEEQLGVALFQRHYSGVLLTYAGQRFIEQIRIGMKHICDGARDAKKGSQTENGCVLVGMSSSLSSKFLTELFQDYFTCYTNVYTDFVDGRLSDHISSVRRNVIDVAFIPSEKQYPDCETTHLWSEQIFAVLPMAHRLAVKPEITWPELSRETFIIGEQAPESDTQISLLKRLADRGEYPVVHRQNIGRDNLMSLVAMGRGVTFASEATASTSSLGLVYRPIIGEMLRFSAVWASRNENPALHQLLRMARDR